MGGGHYEDKNDGGGGYSADELTGDNFKADPGKRTRTQQIGTAKTGLGGVTDEGMACDNTRVDGNDCYLSPLERDRALIEFTRRVTRTMGTWEDACTQVKVDVMLEKEEDLNPVAMFIVTTLG